MQGVDVLGNDGLQLAGLFELGQRLMGGVRCCIKDLTGQWPEPFEESFGGSTERAQGSNVQRLIAGPEAGPLRTEVGDA